MRLVWQTHLGLVALGVLLASGCRAPAPPPPPPAPVPAAALAAKRPVVALKVIERAFEPKHLTLEAKAPVTLAVTNTLAEPYNLTVKDPEGHRIVDVKLPIGQTVEVPFVPTTPGTYIFYSKYTLHRAFGWEGTIEVR
ncbi:MAG: cupredoxin domain-containing protein [Candidatus Tectimicrobiota bacterium]